MKCIYYALVTVCAAALLFPLYFFTSYFFTSYQERRDNPYPVEKLPRTKRKQARKDYLFNLLRDPSTNSFPVNIRTRELQHARILEQTTRINADSLGSIAIDWQETGPDKIGGRTRALAVDYSNPDRVLAGSASGGLWISENGGESWTLQSIPSPHMSVTSITQDPVNPDIWYFSGGEYTQNTPADLSRSAYYRAPGIFKSVDGGKTWNLLQYDFDNLGNYGSLKKTPDTTEVIAYESPLNYVSKILIDKRGYIYVCTAFYGILQSTDNGLSFNKILPTPEARQFPLYCDIVTNQNGNLLASVSQAPVVTDVDGIYTSSDGSNWEQITPAGFPDQHQRTALALANDDKGYVFTLEGVNQENRKEITRLFSVNLQTNAWAELTANLPDFGGKSGFIHTQMNYTMCAAVKPDNSNFVLLGTTNLWRSNNGFTTPAVNIRRNWIGGNNRNPESFDLYPNHHVDQHALIFSPENTNVLWSGHDGGVSRTSAVSQLDVAWEDMNNGYNVTQFYTVALSPDSTDTRFMGGTQDNGTPFGNYNLASTVTSTDVSQGDGGPCYFGEQYAWVSTQYGRIIRKGYLPNGSIDNDNWSIITPPEALNLLYVHPYLIDPADESTMIFPSGRSLFIHRAINDIPPFQQGVSEGWEKLERVVPEKYFISTLASAQRPDATLFFAAYSANDQPRLYKVEHAFTKDPAYLTIEEVAIEGAPQGAYPHHIAVNDNNPNEILVAFSNYNIIGLFHSTDGGENFVAVEGNLKGNDLYPGPSIRTAEIVNFRGKKLYLVGTSTGIYSTPLLSTSTEWHYENAPRIAHSVVVDFDHRQSDGIIMAATHGRGLFTGRARNRLLQQIQFDTITDRSYESNISIPLQATTSSGLAPNFKLVSGNAIISNDTLLVTGAGLIVVEALQEGNDVYEEAVPAVRRFTVQKADQSIAFRPIPDFITIDEPIALNAKANSGLPVSFRIIQGNAEIINDTILRVNEPGNIVVRATQEGNQNYKRAKFVDISFYVESVTLPALDKVVVFPNPSFGVYSIDLSPLAGNETELVITDLQGRLIKQVNTSGKMHELDLRNLAIGQYLLTIGYSDRQKKFRLIKL